jgi:ubiquinone/menaquinone biosynthesis C-methylase UbiE
MESAKRPLPGGTSNSALSYLDLQAYVGTTKHLGGLNTTRELCDLCHVGKDARVLDVGCGVGATACYLAKTYGCRVVGVDLRPAMIANASERAQRQRVEGQVEFWVADAQELPFDGLSFDVVLCESVATFVKDKQKMAGELARVTRPGGYVGLNEQFWLKTPPAERAEQIKRFWGIEADVPTSDEWVRLLTAAGLREIVVKSYRFDARSESSQIRRYGFRDFFRMAYRSLYLSIKSPAFRGYMRERRRVPPGTFEYLGYALFVGRK